MIASILINSALVLGLFVVLAFIGFAMWREIRDWMDFGKKVSEELEHKKSKDAS